MGALFSKKAGTGAAAGEEDEAKIVEPLSPFEAVGTKRPAHGEANTPADGASADTRESAGSPDEPNVPRKRARTDGEQHEVRQALHAKLEAALPQSSTPPPAVAGSGPEVGPIGEKQRAGGQADRAMDEPAEVQQQQQQQQQQRPQQAQSLEQEQEQEPEQEQQPEQVEDQDLGQEHAHGHGQEQAEDAEDAGAVEKEQPVPMMSFGQYVGRPLTHLPASYVCWMCQQQGFFSGSTQRQELCLQMLDLDLIQPAAPGAVSPVTEHEYISGYEPVWRVAPATPEEEAAAEAATMEWGMHKGDLLSELPSDHVSWMCNIAEDFWDLDQPRKRKLLRHLEVLGRVRYTEEGRVVRAGGERSARRHGFGSYFGYEAACRGAPCGAWCADYGDDEF
ncbi:hypothetical protein HYH02_011294 [Chlamydomonas schloesseri]|uniref:Uncharacterized protein n=1 Tax=Chlamydomonas schloesseri TaxID=2026947 RepID=A0A835TEZ6_9CHLO|nr:hypothetical protein HYH02_011294 [Chlamydomonas schloesseri]|eukprot:KAG2437031.1 hypothetical protein HYH02_011294 [Chlamydomonas schloesseri]